MREKPGPKQKLVVDEDFLKNMEQYGILGAKAEEIYLFYGVSAGCWYDALKKYPEIRERLNKGRMGGISQVMGVLYKAAVKGNISACKAYLQSQMTKLEGNTANCGIGNRVEKEFPTKLNTTDPVEAAKIYRQIILGEEVRI